MDGKEKFFLHKYFPTSHIHSVIFLISNLLWGGKFMLFWFVSFKLKNCQNPRFQSARSSQQKLIQIITPHLKIAEIIILSLLTTKTTILCIF